MSDSPALWLDRHQHDLALQVDDEEWDYTRLSQRTKAIAAALQRQSVRHGDLLALSDADPLAVMLFAHAALRCGVALFPINPAYPVALRDQLLLGSGVRWIGGVPPTESLPSGIRHLAVTLETTATSIPFTPSPLPTAAAHLLVATSGSSGEPRAVMLSGANLMAAVAASMARLPLWPGDRWLCCLPLYHIGGLSILYRCAAAGAAVLLQRGFDTDAVGHAIMNEGVTHLSLVPAMLAKLLDAGVRPSSGLRHVLIGGGPLSPALAARARATGWPLCVSYGLSETGSQLATDCSEVAGQEHGVIGRPLEGFEVDCPPCSAPPGRLRVRGSGVMMGYANPQRLPGDGLEAGWYETADLVCRTAEGSLKVLGRADDILVSGGVNIHPAQVEAVLAGLPGIGEVAVTGIPDPVWGERLVAVYCGTAEAGVLAEAARTLLPSPLRPRLWFRVTELPRVGLQKLNRHALQALAVRLTGQSGLSASR